RAHGDVLRIAAEDPHGAARGPRHGEQHLDERRLARAVRADEAEGLPRLDAQLEAIEGALGPPAEEAGVSLGEAEGFDRRGRHGPPQYSGKELQSSDAPETFRQPGGGLIGA